MKVQILPPAMEDLANGRTFYDSREKGVGAYFMDSLFSEIDSLRAYPTNQWGGARSGIYRPARRPTGRRARGPCPVWQRRRRQIPPSPGGLSEKAGWACVVRYGMGLWPTSASAALAEPAFPLNATPLVSRIGS
jgi:hypothetical protein